MMARFLSDTQDPYARDPNDPGIRDGGPPLTYKDLANRGLVKPALRRKKSFVAALKAAKARREVS